MAVPVPLMIAGGSAALGLLGNIFSPKAPDLVNPVRNEYDFAIQRLLADQEEAARMTFETSAAGGLSGASLLMPATNIFRTNARERSQLEATAADRIIDATNRQNMANYEARARRFQNMMAGFGTGAQIAGAYYSSPNRGDFGVKSNPTDVMGKSPITPVNYNNIPGLRAYHPMMPMNPFAMRQPLP